MVPEPTEIEKLVAAAKRVNRDALLAREELRWRVRKGDPDRKQRIDTMIANIDRIMKPVRSMVARLLWEPVPEAQAESLRAVSQSLQYERRQLKKMRT